MAAVTKGWKGKFRFEKTFEERRQIAARASKLGATVIPIIVERDPKCRFGEPRKKILYAPSAVTFATIYSHIIMNISGFVGEPIFITINGEKFPPETRIGDIYSKHREEDGLMYAVYTSFLIYRY